MSGRRSSRNSASVTSFAACGEALTVADGICTEDRSGNNCREPNETSIQCNTGANRSSWKRKAAYLLRIGRLEEYKRRRHSGFVSVFNQLDAQNLFHNKFYFVPLHVSSTSAHHQEVKIALHSLWYHHTDRCTRWRLNVLGE